ncbi:carbohydrate binding domain-containing protein [Ruania zhangjianzhongii]|uniref:carbohydrate binding domain-containing protein n=1 Tax=Ruania zhangjianzhongii TaxID=2603206 RepID=UPI0011CAA37C|nr:carbohydrate binding domain-containing protein [Ruania zhangjianzhongii]
MRGNSRAGTLVGAAAALAVLTVTAVAGSPAEADPTAEDNLLANASFEQLDDQGWPTGWQPMWASSTEAFWSDSDQASDGSTSMRVLDESDARGYAIRSDTLSVTEGDSHRLALDVRLDSGTLQPSVLYLDEDGERVSLDHQRVRSTDGAWSSQGFLFTVPEGATQAQVLLDTTIAFVSDGWVDNVTFSPATPDEATGTEEDLGQPITGLTNAGAGYTEDAQGRDIGLVVAGGSPSQFSAVDLITGERLMTETIEGSTLTWAYATTPDRMVYLATASGQVYRFDPDALTLTQIADQPLGETYFWEAGVNADGDLFFATYPGGKLLGYQPETDTWQDYGTLVEGNSYARSLAVAGDDVYVGGGTATPSLTRVDTATGGTESIELPAEYADQEFVYDVSLAGDTLFARVSPANTVLVYSLTDGAWVDTIENAVGLEVSPAVTTSDSGTERTEVLIPEIGGGMIAYDLDTREQRAVSIDLGGASARGWAVMDVGLEGFPGESLVTATSKAVFHVWNPQTGETRLMRTDAMPTPFQIRSLGTGPQGDAWVGGYASPPGIAQVDAETGQSVLRPGPGQVEGMVAHGDDLVIGTYPGALLYTYDSTQDWENGTNPPERVSIEHGQDRPVAWVSAGESVAIGTVPDYGHLGGALTFFDPDTQQMSVVEGVIEDQTVISLAYADGLVYGGTGIWGGLGIDPSTSEGQLFIFDPSTGEVVYQDVPVPGEENVSGLAFGPDGDLWGITANTLFRFDPETREIVERQRYFDVDDSAAYWTTRELVFRGDRLVGQTAGRVFEIDPQTLQMTVIATGTQNLAVDRLGSYYYNRGGTLYRWVPDAPAPACDRTITGRHAGPLRVEDEVLCVTGGELAGPVRITTGASIVMTDSSVVGPISADGADTVQLRSSHITGPVSVTGTVGEVLIAGNTIIGPLRCDGNISEPTNGGEANTVTGPAAGQCAGL